MTGFGAGRDHADYTLLTYFACILIFGLIMLSSASTAVGIARFGDSHFFIKRQIYFGVIPGLVLFFFFARFSYKIFARNTSTIFVGTILLLLLVFIPGIGSALNTGSKSWMVIGGFSLQPSEFAKLGLVLFLAGYLSQMKEKIWDFQHGFLVALGTGLVPALMVVAEPDVGTASILFAIIFGMLLLAGARWTHMGLLALFGIVAIVSLIIVAPYRAARLTTFLHPELDPQGIGYHINQAELAIGSGGFWGLGLGRSVQKFQYLPEVHADSIFAVISEEMGFLVSVVFLVLLTLAIFRGLKVARNASDDYGRLVAGGILIWFSTQSIMNIGAMVGMLPLTGVPLPFVSHGGTALAISMGAVGILTNISAYART